MKLQRFALLLAVAVPAAAAALTELRGKGAR